MKSIRLFSILIPSLLFAQQNPTDTADFKAYWYAGKAEISSYTLEQARYGEIRKGKAVHIFVTEPFSLQYNTKADDSQNPDNITVLKLNATKKFNTGIYPYSLMTSSFVPVSQPQAAIKISASSQEWCGHEYVELVNKNSYFELSNFSYFQGKSFTNLKIDQNTVLEDDLWSKIRLNPKNLPTGTFKALPSFVYLRFSHSKIKAYQAQAQLTYTNNQATYTLTYPALNRSLKITFYNTFPFQILNWEETYESGFGNQKKLRTTKATLQKSILSDYWNQKKNEHLPLRKELGLPTF